MWLHLVVNTSCVFRMNNSEYCCYCDYYIFLNMFIHFVCRNFCTSINFKSENQRKNVSIFRTIFLLEYILSQHASNKHQQWMAKWKISLFIFQVYLGYSLLYCSSPRMPSTWLKIEDSSLYSRRDGIPGISEWMSVILCMLFISLLLFLTRVFYVIRRALGVARMLGCSVLVYLNCVFIFSYPFRISWSRVNFQTEKMLRTLWTVIFFCSVWQSRLHESARKRKNLLDQYQTGYLSHVGVSNGAVKLVAFCTVVSSVERCDVTALMLLTMFFLLPDNSDNFLC